VQLARAVQQAGMLPVFVTDEACIALFETLSARMLASPVECRTFPTDVPVAAEVCEHLLDAYRPAIVFAVERPGPNRTGTYVDMHGNDLGAFVGKTHALISGAQSRVVPTVGIGDGGNELGMGRVTVPARYRNIFKCSTNSIHRHTYHDTG
jgi:hypothetical protein